MQSCMGLHSDTCSDRPCHELFAYGCGTNQASKDCCAGSWPRGATLGEALPRYFGLKPSVSAPDVCLKARDSHHFRRWLLLGQVSSRRRPSTQVFGI